MTTTFKLVNLSREVVVDYINMVNNYASNHRNDYKDYTIFVKLYEDIDYGYDDSIMYRSYRITYSMIVPDQHDALNLFKKYDINPFDLEILDEDDEDYWDMFQGYNWLPMPNNDIAKYDTKHGYGFYFDIRTFNHNHTNALEYLEFCENDIKSHFNID